MSFSSRQLRAMAISPRVASSLSIPGSCFILAETYSDYRAERGAAGGHDGASINASRHLRRQARNTPMQRALAGMSCVDVLSSLAWFASTWAAPEDSGALQAAGNGLTCRIQGFLLHIAIGAPLYNGALILYYLGTIKYGWQPQTLRCIEPWIHAAIWTWCVGTGVTVWAMDLLHFIGPVCWITDPPECWLEDVPDGVVCDRAKRFSTFLFCIPLWICLLATMYGLVAIFLALRSTIRAVSQRTLAGTQTNVLRRSSQDLQAVALRAVLYSLAFVLTWAASTIWSVAQWYDYFPFWTSYAWTLMEPLQGFWNVLIFLHNRPSSREKVGRICQTILKPIVCDGCARQFKASGRDSDEAPDTLRKSDTGSRNMKRKQGNTEILSGTSRAASSCGESPTTYHNEVTSTPKAEKKAPCLAQPDNAI